MSRRRCRARAYPRAGGGTSMRTICTRIAAGLSPRRRGNLVKAIEAAARMGPIPAQAGEPGCEDGSHGYLRAYPRAGGGTTSTTCASPFASGLSPRRRGNRLTLPTVGIPTGPIPAQAGEPSSLHRGGRADRAYPRAGGGTASERDFANQSTGLSPRRRGNPRPRRRGATTTGPIPAQAGEPARCRAARCGKGAYPRAGGGTPCYQVLELLAMSKSGKRIES